MQFVFNHTTFDPGNEMDQAALAPLKTVGVEPGKQYDANKVPALAGKQLAAVAAKIAAKQNATWNDPKGIASFEFKLFQPKGQMDIDTMVPQSVVGPIGQPADQAMYPGITTPDGQPMNAQHDYVVRMTKEEMKLDASGGIEIHIAAEQPVGVPAENWLPINREDLGIGVIMRVYAPDLEKMKTWKAPKAERLK